MASAGFMFVEANGVTIRGASLVSSQDRADAIQVVELHHDCQIPAESMTRRPSGARVHRPIRVVARVDKATPLMYKAWSLNEPCEVRLRFWHPDPNGTGQEVEFFQIDLNDASVIGVKMHWPNALATATATMPEQVEYSFSYRTITWTVIEGGIVHTDQWGGVST